MCVQFAVENVALMQLNVLFVINGFINRVHHYRPIFSSAGRMRTCYSCADCVHSPQISLISTLHCKGMYQNHSLKNKIFDVYTEKVVKKYYLVSFDSKLLLFVCIRPFVT